VSKTDARSLARVSWVAFPQNNNTHITQLKRGDGIEASVKMASVCDDCNGRLVLPKKYQRKASA
jgi:hypothetical protein